ncbi:hypothetical protein [Rodentibacter haemolyticus]|uniref:Lipoprotein n=1 Tax=Rodentibacter haemolyticus TaxID=2778911 RepID=A0ABX6V0I1_9PAST|nr:hypothetical protein [Rodentibacter haemolyticus]QPB43229.1 hypothetical protein IHV77_03745 [Rodentibacter haemolyticus]
MKNWYVLVISFYLTGCYFHNGCWYSPQNVSCVDKGGAYPYIAFFQKTETIGHTDTAQRWVDVKLCGGVNISKKENSFNIKGDRDNNMVIIPEVVERFEKCMGSKGYIRLKGYDCGNQNPKWSTGKCNL